MTIKPTRREFIKSAALAGGALLLPRPRIAGGAPSYAQTELLHTIRRCGLTGGLKLCLDAGDANSYSSGQSWLDTSGNGYDFFRGPTVGAEASDPTFNGTAGQRASGNYWSCDGGDYFRYDSANETWMQNLHKDNAVLTMVAWVYPTTAGPIYLWGSSGGTTGSIFYCTSSLLVWLVQNGGATVLNIFTAATLNLNAWNFVAASLTEATGANGAILQVNGVQGLFTSTYTAPSAASASYTAELGAAGGGIF